MTGGKNRVRRKIHTYHRYGDDGIQVGDSLDCRGREVSSATEEYQIQTPQPGMGRDGSGPIY